MIMMMKKSPINAVTGERLQQLLSTLFLDIEKSPVAFRSPKVVYDYLREELGITAVPLAAVKKFEAQHVRPNQVNRDVRHGRAPTLAYYAPGLDSQWQIDLVDLHRSNNANNTYSFALTKIDLFSRQVDAELITRKTADKVTKAFDAICRRKGRWPDTLQSDEGKEFLNKTFKDYCKRKSIKFFVVNNEKKVSLLERFNRTYQGMLYKYKQARPKASLTVLNRQVVTNYNETRHSMHGFRPADITVEVAAKMAKVERVLKLQRARENAKKSRPFKFKVGDTVRTVVDRGVFSKAYRGTFTQEVFRIARRYRKFPDYHINLYRLQDLTDEKILGVYYERELQKVYLPPDRQRRISKVLKRSKRLGKLVTFEDYPSTYTEWVR